MLYRVVYTSRAASPEGLSPSMAAEIIGHAQNANQRRNITGFLVLNGPEILQVLEGSKFELERLLAALQTDPRHTSVRVMSFEPVAGRTLESSMSLCAPTDGLLATVGIHALAELTRQDIEPLIALHQAA